MKSIYIAATFILLSSCFQEDEAVIRLDRGDVSNIEIAMGENYGEQLFYDLNSNTIVKHNPRTAWDIAFSSEAGSTVIKLNSGRFMLAAETTQSDMSKITDTAGLEFLWDYVNGAEDSMSLFEWDLADNVYVVDMGYDLEGSNLGYIKIKFTKVSDVKVSFEYMSLDGSNPGSGSLEKDQEYNFSYYSILNESKIVIEPKKDEYDLYFGQYIFYFEAEDLPYYVNGVLLNPNQVEASPYFDVQYEEISSDNLDALDFKTQPDLIGYTWKYYNAQASRYEVVDGQNYLVKDVEGYYYKIRFTGFYNKDGIKGHPQLELKKL
jgi:hypothetical protein